MASKLIIAILVVLTVYLQARFWIGEGSFAHVDALTLQLDKKLAGFGIMFAVLSWFQEAGILSSEIGGYKGWAAVSTGLVLYFLVGRRLGD